MSSVKKLNMCRSEKCNGTVSHCSEDSHVKPKRRNMPPILRLDSTGEVTSHDFGENRTRGCDRRCHFSKKMNDSLKNIVDYVGAASSSFIDGTGISKHLTDHRNPFDCVKKMWHSCNENQFDGYKSGKIMTDTMKTETVPSPGGNPVGGGQIDTYPFLRNWSNSVLGAFHGNGYKSPWQSFHKQTYSPYNRRPDLWQNKKRQNINHIETDNTVDPSLKPYNARLLQKSKQCKKSNPITNTVSEHVGIIAGKKQEKVIKSSSKETDSPKPKVYLQDDSQISKSTDDSAQVHVALETEILSVGDVITDKSPKPLKSLAQVKTAKLQNGFQEINSAHEKSANENENEVTDWFEYENKDLRTIPIELHDIEAKCEIDHASPENDAAFVHPSLTSWCSIDIDAEGVKCKSENLTKKKDQPCSGDRIQDCMEQSKNNADICKSKENPCDMKKINVKIENLNTSPKSKLKPSDIKDCSETEADKSFVLYVRNFKKSSKPSCKKRRRQRAKKECNTGEKSKADSASEKIETKSDCKGKENPIAFILGIDAQAYTAGEAQPFLVSCDINSDSDWSDSENECDESPEETSILDELSMFNLCEDFNPLNFKVTCSVQPTPTENSSHIDAINLSWQVNVCVSPATQNRKPADKKVHFANEEDLVVIHPETAEWCQAYEEARIGPWVQFAADRERFKKRITDSEIVLNPILSNDHREKVYSDRFCED